jgi:hypothetical protein
MIWKESVEKAIKRLTKKTGSRVFSRRQLIEFELDQVIGEVGSDGKTPHQTLSRVLQELRNDKAIKFEHRGVYRFLR